MNKLMLNDLIKGLPTGEDKDRYSDIQHFTLKNDITTIVLDDDPTGTQTVHGIPVLTQWSAPLIEQELSNKTPLFFILTNSRSLHEDAAVLLNKEIGEMICQASRKTNRKVRIISRSDSTLRGHYPAEVDALKIALCLEESAEILIPAFYQGGRYTIQDIHYVEENGILIPAAETPFARDKSFGYTSSNLIDWIVEKRGNSITRERIGSISLEEIRRYDIDSIMKKLENPNYSALVINVVTENDLKVVVLALLKAENNGKKFIYRTASSIIPVITGIIPKPILDIDDFNLDKDSGGLIVVGSYVPKSTEQLNFLLQNENVIPCELKVEDFLEENDQNLMDEIARDITRLLSLGKNPMLYTSRELITGKDKAESLEIINKVAGSVNYIISRVAIKPRFVIAKGGITSSDIAVKCFGVTRAQVAGQILPGVPVWELDGKWEGLTYVVFPGNVGTEDSLSQAFRKLNTK